MKRKLLINILIAVSLVVIYIIADSKLYYYGQSNFNIVRNSLPLVVEPEYWDSHYCWPMREFTLKKDPDLLLQKYVSFAVENDTIIVASINKYGICENNLRVFITDEKNNRYSVHISGEDNLKIDICPISITDEMNDYDIYRWFSFEDDDKTMGKLTLIRVGCLLFAICYFSIIGIFTIFVKKSKK